MNVSKLIHDSASIGFIAGVLLLVGLPILMATGTLQKVLPFTASEHTASNTFSSNPPYTPPQSTRESIPTGTYAGWTQYHHLGLGFSVNIPSGLIVDELPQTQAEKPRYPEFVLLLSHLQDDEAMEYARVTVYDSPFSVNTAAQEISKDPLFSSKPTVEKGTLRGHKSVQYFYSGETRTVVYLIDNGAKTYEVRGFIHETDPNAVADYWKTFNSMLGSFTIDD